MRFCFFVFIIRSVCYLIVIWFILNYGIILFSNIPCFNLFHRIFFFWSLGNSPFYCILNFFNFFPGLLNLIFIVNFHMKVQVSWSIL